MNVLVLPQYSMRSYQTGKWLINKDANIKLMEYFCKIVKEIESSSFFHLVLPNEVNLNQLPEDNFFRQDHAVCLHAPHGNNALSQRYNFPYKEFEKLIKESKATLVLCPLEKVANFKAIKKNLKVIGFNHYLDFYTMSSPLESKYMLRDIDGVLNSDLTYFNTHTNMLNFMCHEFVNNSLYQKLFPKCKTSNILYSKENLEKYVPKPNATKVITFISRLSDLKRTKADVFIRVAKQIQETTHIDVVITDPNNSKEIEVPSSMIMAEFEGEDFYEYMTLRPVVPIMYDLHKWASVGITEAIACGAIPIEYKGDDKRFYEDLIAFKTNMTYNVELLSLEYNKARVFDEITAIL